MFKLIFKNMKIRLLFLLSMGLCFMTCKNQDKLYAEDMIGTWDVYLSQMNSKPNGLMKDAYFTFQKENTVTSNIFDENKPLHYDVENGRLKIDSEVPFDLNIKRMENDSLYLEGQMSHYYMEYFLVKRK